MSHAHDLVRESIQVLTEAYDFALSHNSAARLDDPGKVNFQIEQTCDKAVDSFELALKKLDAIRSD